MQAGFAMVETGLREQKTQGIFYEKPDGFFRRGIDVLGRRLGAYVRGKQERTIGGNQFFLSGAEAASFRDWMFQVVFAATAATIVSGAMAERTKFSGYIVYSVFITALVYPISGHWIWNGDGWLALRGFHDFAGSTVVHSVGAWAALVGAMMIGPRTGKYVRVNGQVAVKAIPGHNLPLAASGSLFSGSAGTDSMPGRHCPVPTPISPT